MVYVFGTELYVDIRKEEKERGDEDRGECTSRIMKQKLSGTKEKDEGDPRYYDLETEHSAEGVRRYQMGEAVDQPEERALAVSEIHVWHHPREPGFPSHHEPCGVNVGELDTNGAVGTHEDHQEGCV